MRATSLVAVAGLIAPALCGGKLVSPKELIKLIKLEDLLDGSQKLQDIADANGGNRAFGGAGHNATVDWIYNTLKKTGFYDVSKQSFVELFSAANVDFSAGGTEYVADYMVRQYLLYCSYT